MGDETQPDAALEPETIEIELDPARAVMYRLAVQAAGDEGVVRNFIETQVQEATKQLYDSRDDLAAQRDQMEAQDGESDGTDIVTDAQEAEN